MKKSRTILSVLSLCTLLLCFPACTGAGVKKPSVTTADTTAPAETLLRDERADVTDDLPSLDLGGQTLTILCRGPELVGGDATTQSTKNMYADEIFVYELTNEVLNDALYNRTIAVETRLNVDLNIVEYGGDTSSTNNNDARQLMEKAMNAGSDDYQLYFNSAAPSVSDSMKGWFYDLNSLDYLNFDQPWWYTDFNTETEIMGRQYCADGSLSLSTLRSACAVFFNKRLAENHGNVDFYGMVRDGSWAIDRQAEITASVYQDLNGNSLRDEEDLYGFLPVGYWATDAYISAFEINILSRDTDGLFFLDCDYEKMTTAHEKLYQLYHGNVGSRAALNYESGDDMVRAFAGGKALMLSAMLYWAEDGETLRNMQDDYGIIPEPKFDENQTEYHSNPYECATVFTVPVTNPDPDTAAAVLEALNAETYRRVITSYSDVALKGKYLNDAESRRMFDLIVDGMTFEAGQLYCYQIGEFPQWVFRYPIDWDEPESYLRQYTTLSHKIPRLLGIMNDTFAELEYEPESLDCELGKKLHEKYRDLPWIEIASHNHIPELSGSQNASFPHLKRHLVVGVRKTMRLRLRKNTF